MPRFYVESALPAGGGIYQLTGDAAHRIGRVLRMKPGERLRLFDGSGRELEGLIAGLTGGAVTVALAQELPPEPPRPAVHLYQALIRPNRFEWLIEKATELGAAAIQPVVSARCQVRAAEFGESKTARWGRILVEAAEQCGRRTLPVLRPPLPFERALRQAPGLVLLAWEESREDSPSLGAVVREARHAPSVEPGSAAGGAAALEAVSLFIGPEGGFASDEVRAARTRGARVVSLGPRVLRAETAALAALAIVGDALTYPPPTPFPRREGGARGTIGHAAPPSLAGPSAGIEGSPQTFKGVGGLGLISTISRMRRTATVGATGARVYLGYKRTQRRVARLPAAAREAAWAAQHERAAERIAATARRLRGLYVKSAQFLGARADLLPEQYIVVLSQLHDRVPPQPYAAIRSVLRDSLGDEPERVFARFERAPVAAASLAQVHRARLRDGREVAVKVQYPDIERLVQLDLRNLRTILRLVHRVEPSFDLEPLAQAVARLVPQELDFVNEGRSLETIGAALAHRGDVTVPAVVWEHTSRRVLVTEYVEGTKVSEVEALRAQGLDPRAVAERVVDVWGEQVLGRGHFHGDPHPGNILVLPDGRLALVDFGLTARLDPAARAALARLCRAASRRDIPEVVAAFQGLGFVAPAGDPLAYPRIGGNLLGTGGGVESVNVRIARALRGFNLAEVPAEALLVLRVLGLLAGLSARLGRTAPVLPAWLPYAGDAPAAVSAGD